jgi:hypothetical protein
MILFILPTLFIVLLGPAILGVVDTFSGKSQQTTTVTTTTPRDSGTPGRTIVVQRTNAPVKTLPRQETPTEATVVPTETSARAGDLITVDIDARALRGGSQLRIAIVPTGTLDAAGDAELARNTVPVLPDRMRVSLSAATPGAVVAPDLGHDCSR